MKIRLFFLVILLSGCERSDLNVYLKCGMAATNLDEQYALVNISNSMNKYIDDHKIKFSSSAKLQLQEEIYDYLNYYTRSDEARLATWIKIFNSSECVNVHEQEKISGMPLSYYLVYFFL